MPGFLSEAFVSFQGEGLHVGRRQLFLRFAGCPLRCRYCDTPDSLVPTREFAVRGGAEIERSRPNPVTVADICWAIELLTGDGSVDGVALTGGEPLAQPEFLLEVLRLDAVPAPRLLETSGTLPVQLERVIDLIDVVSMDLKLPSNTGETSFWDQHRRFLEVAAGKAYVKILIDAGTSAQDLRTGVDLIRRVSPTTPVFLQPITLRNGGVGVGASDLSRMYSLARDYLDDVRVLPQTHKMMGIP